MICPRCSVGEISEATQECLVCGFSRTGGVVVEASDWNRLDDPILPALERQFQVEGVLRRGTTSRIYLARDQVTGRLCSLKVLPLSDDLPAGLIDRFRKDAQRAATLDHPHLVSMLSFGATDEAVWYAMEYVQGRSLGDLLRTADRMDLKTCLRLVEQIGSALEYGHRRGMIHGNLKPANVLVDPEGWARVADFGVNAAFGTLPRRAPEQSIEENYGHTAPEQFGDAGELGPAADQYALAVLAFACLARRPPFVGETLEEITQHHLEGPIPLVAESRPDLPAYVSSALARAMSREPADRFPGVLDFATALAGVALPEPAPLPVAQPETASVETAPVVASKPEPEPVPSPAPMPVAELPPALKLEPEPAAKQPEPEPAAVASAPVKLEPPAIEPAPEPVAAVAETAASTEAAAPEAEEAPRTPLLFVERGGRSRARDDEDEDENEDENDELRRKIALARDVHRQATAAQDDEEEEREEKLSEPVLLWPGPREPAPATPAAPAAAAASAGAEHERPRSFVFLDPNHVAALPPRLRQMAENFWQLTARWRTLPKNIRYGSPAAAAVVILALVWWRVARGHEERGPNYVTESPPAGLADSGTPRSTPPRAGTPRTRPSTPRTTPPAGGTTTPTNPAPRDTGARRPPPGPTGGAVEPAHLFIAASPWGVLYVDDRQIGNTPQADVKVPPGTHSIRITRDGYLPYETIIAIEAGESLRLTDIVLQEKPQ
jgi:serine/threonine protein kinase